MRSDDGCFECSQAHNRTVRIFKIEAPDPLVAKRQAGLAKINHLKMTIAEIHLKRGAVRRLRGGVSAKCEAAGD